MKFSQEIALLVVVLSICFPHEVLSFQTGRWGVVSKAKTGDGPLPRSTRLLMAKDGDYSNKVAEFLSNFLPIPDGKGSEEDPLQNINFNAPKARKVSLSNLAKKLDQELRQREWFVTGQVNPIYFSDDFVFEDPDIRTEGIEGA
jgi:hypothetical protein